MLPLKPRRQYLISDVLEKSGYYRYRTQLIDRMIIPKPPIFDNCGSAKLPHNIRCGYVKVLTGVMRGQTIYLNRFTATIISRREVCNCGAYTFPHTEGGGKCLTNENDAWCDSCGLACTPKYIDEGIGETEFWGISSVHHDWVWRSDCCDSEVKGNAERTLDFDPRTLEQY